MGVRKSEREWAVLAAAFEKSGQSLARFCKARQLKPKTFSWWRWRLREREEASEKAVRMVAVELATPTAVAAQSVLIGVGGVSVHVEVGTDTKYIGALIAALRLPC